jgi:hypothetical protein
MRDQTRKQLEQSLEFEQTQLTILEQQAAKQPPTGAVQITNWQKLLESHRRSIAFFTARLGDLSENQG